MKTWTCSILGVAGALALCAAAQAPAPAPDTPVYANAHEKQLHTDWADLLQFQAADEAIDALGAPQPGQARVVFMGDSITAGWKDLNVYFPGKNYINRGISGQTTPQMLVRFRQDVVNLHPRAVVILAGINDIAENTGPMRLEDIESDFASMDDLAHANGIRVVLCSTMPAKRFPWAPTLFPAAQVQALDAWLRPYAAAHGDVYVDLYTALTDDQGGMRAELSKDGVHPNRQGYLIMAPLIQQGIDAALASTAPSK